MAENELIRGKTKFTAMILKLQFQRSKDIVLMPVALALIVSSLALLQGSCRPYEEQPEEVDIRQAPAPWQLVDTLIQSGNDLRQLDVLDIEGTAGLRSSEREQVRTKILGVASGHARKYRDHLLQLARLPQQRAKNEIDARLAANRKISRLHDIVKVMDLHLRLVRADTPPSESRIIWDFGNLRYANSSER